MQPSHYLRSVPSQRTHVVILRCYGFRYAVAGILYVAVAVAPAPAATADPADADVAPSGRAHVFDMLVIQLRSTEDAAANDRTTTPTTTARDQHQMEAIRQLQTAFSLRDLRPLFSVRKGAREQVRPGARHNSPELAVFLVARARPNANINALIAFLKRDPRVTVAERVGIVRASTTDPYLASSGSWDQAYDDMWGYHAIGIPEIPSVIAGSDVTVAVLDTGIDPSHPDLSVATGGYDYIDDDSIPNDENGHGTHVAGIIAAIKNNGTGIAGVAPGVTLVTYKVLDATGNGPTTALAQAIRDASDDGADVISMSLGTLGEAPEHVKAAVAYAAANGVVMVGAAGNDGLSELHYPANLPEVIAVSNWTPDDTLRSTSNRGPEIEFTAPGTGILSLRSFVIDPDFLANTIPVAEDYLVASGTSQATPYVAGVAALALARFPGTTAEETREHLKQTARDVGSSGVDDESGHGMIDAAQALSLLPRSFVRPAVTDRGTQWAVAIDAEAERIAYLDGAGSGRVLVVRELETGEATIIPTSATRILAPRIDDRFLVYQGAVGGWTRVFVYNLDAGVEMMLPGDQSNQLGTLIDGTTIVYGDDASGRLRLHRYDIIEGTTAPVHSDADRYGSAAIRDGRLIFAAERGGFWNVYTHNLATGHTFQVTDDTAQQLTCATNGRLLAWGTHTGAGHVDLFVYDLGEDRLFGTADDRDATQVTEDGNWKRWLSMSNAWLVWEQHDGAPDGTDDTNIYGYGLGSDGVHGTADDLGPLQITTHAANQLNPEVSGNIVIWEDLRNGNDAELNVDLYMATLPSPRASPTPSAADQADMDDDGDVDLADYLRFQQGCSGAGVLTPDPATDLDHDGDTDLADLIVFQSVFSGSG